jgi:hypothetical protein
MAYEVWETLGRVAPTTVADLARAAGRHRNPARKALRKLAEHGLASKDGDRWVWRERDLDELAAELGAGQLRERRRQRYAADREGHQRHLERQAEREREREERRLQREQRDRTEAAQPAPERPKRRSLARRGHEPDLVAASQAAQRDQMAAADGKRGQRAALARRRAVCQGPEGHEQWFSDATLDHLSCGACGARFRWAA